MKSFPFVYAGREYHLRKLDQDAKDDLADRFTAGRLRQAQRMVKKGYLTPAEFLDAKQGAYVKWGSEGFVTELVDPENAKAFVRAILVEPVDDATLGGLVAEQRKEASDLRTAINLLVEDDLPKAPTPPA